MQASKDGLEVFYPEIPLAHIRDALSSALGRELETPEARAWAVLDKTKVRKQGSGRKLGSKNKAK